MLKGKLRLALALLATLAATGGASSSSAVAQDAPAPATELALEIGEVREGTLDRLPVETLGRREYPLLVPQGSAVSVDLESDDFDPLLRILRVVDGRRQVVAGNDDNGDSFNARLRVTAGASADTQFIVEVIGPKGSAFAETPTHAHFRLTVNREKAPPPLKIVPLPADPAVAGQFRVSERQFATEDEAPDGQGFVHNYSFQGEKGQRIVVDVRTAFLEGQSNRLGAVPPPGIAIRRTDNTGPTIPLNSRRVEVDHTRIIGVLPASGSYRLIATDPSSHPMGRYDLTARLWTIAPPVERKFALGETKQGTFSYTDPPAIGEFGEIRAVVYQEWFLPVRRGQKIRLEMCGSDPLDSLIQIIGETSIGDRAIARADDLAEGETASCGSSEKNARLDFTAQTNDVLRIWASPLRDPEAGTYTLTASEIR